MTKQEYLDEVARIHEEWSVRVTQRRAGNPVDTSKTGGGEFEAEGLATLEDETEYWVAVQELTARFRAEHPIG